MKKKILKVLTGMILIIVTTACGKNEETAVDTRELSTEFVEIEESKDSVGEVQKESIASDFEFEEENGNLTLVKYNGTAKNVDVPDNMEGKSVTAIGERAFSQNADIVEVTLPDSVITIGEAAFTTCENLRKVMLGANTESIGVEAFYMSSQLEEINFPNTITIIEKDALSVTAVKEVTLPMNLTILGGGAFAISEIKKIIIPGTIKEIEERAFQRCSQLKEVEIQEGVETIAYGTFADNDNLTTVIIPNSVIDIDGSAFINSYDVTITTPIGSYAEQYAKENDIPCITK